MPDAKKVTVCPVTCRVAEVADPSPYTLKELSNHTLSPAGMAVPLKFAAMVESVAAELELEAQPFTISSAALGNGGPQFRSESEDNFLAAFNRETQGRRDR